MNPDITITGLTIAPSATVPANLVLSFNVKAAGANFTTLTRINGAYRFDGTNRDDLAAVDAAFPGDLVRTVTLAGGTGGNYTVTIADGATLFGGVPSRYLVRLETASGLVPRVRALAMGNYPSSPDANLVSSAGCTGCHGTNGGGGFHYSYPANGAACTVCHDAVNVIEAPWTVDMGHSIHASHLMPSGEFELKKKDGTSFTDRTTGLPDPFIVSATYPTYMTNCSVCHTASSGALTEANKMAVTGPGCFSCHESMESWDFAPSGLTFHETFAPTEDCTVCHRTGGVASSKVKVEDFHNGLETERVGIIWSGDDTSVTQGKDFTWKITKVVDDKTAGKLAVSWEATYKGAPANPCATTVTASQPGFLTARIIEGQLGMLRSYAQGDDYVLGQASGPGQPPTVTLYATGSAGATATNVNTSCLAAAPFTATTSVTRDNLPDGTRGIVSLVGRPQVLLPTGFAATEHAANWKYTDGTLATTMYVRVPVPTYEFVVGTGAAATPRRVIADTQECLGCHVGSLYQHGNTRVDNVTNCIICHNSASSEQNNRVLMGVTASEAYDGLVGQTFEFKTMLHAIHSAGSDLAPFVVYRTRGIYAWTAEGSTLPNWPTGAPTCRSSVDAAAPAPITGYLVFGADPAVSASCQTHNLYHPTYPRDTKQCSGCHVAGFRTIPDQAKAVATTLDAGKIDSGTGTSAVWKNQLDDTLQGASAAACTSCHNTTDSRGHAYQNGWTPQTFEKGRQTILETR